jgi:hypothetical protein
MPDPVQDPGRACNWVQFARFPTFLRGRCSPSLLLFNEEVGETSFSILSRLVLGDTTKCSFKHIDLMYGLIHTYRANNADMAGVHTIILWVEIGQLGDIRTLLESTDIGYQNVQTFFWYKPDMNVVGPVFKRTPAVEVCLIGHRGLTSGYSST